MHTKPWLMGLILLCWLPATVQAEVDARIVRTLELDAAPLDIAVPDRGDYIYVLSADATLMIFRPDGTLRDTLPVDPGVDGIQTGPADGQLFLRDTRNNRVQLLILDFIHPIPIHGSPTKGSPRAPVTVTVFTDFQCPYCAKLAPILDQLMETYPQKVRLVFKNYPLRSHRFALPAAAAALAAHAQGKFWAFHDKLFANHRSLNEAKILEIRDALNLDADGFDTQRKSSRVTRQIQDDIRLGQKVGLRGTPSVYVNGRLQRSRSLEALLDAVERALRRTGGSDSENR